MTITTEVRRALRKQAVSHYGCLSDLATPTGRRRYPRRESPFGKMNPFIADEDKLNASKAVRGLAHKTQVFTDPDNHHIRTREQHVKEVTGTTVLGANMLGLNADLARAASIGHDIGHVPFGHQGEKWMAEAMGNRLFCHEILGPVVTQRIERKGRGLNLTFETMDAMMRHSGDTAREGMSQEAWLLRYTDKITYIFHDINDIERTGYPIPKEVLSLANDFGHDQRARRSAALCALVIESAERGRVSFEHSDWAKKFARLRTLMYRLYHKVTQQDVSMFMEPTFKFLQRLDLADPFLLLALLTDKEVATILSTRMTDANLFRQLGLSEIAPHLEKIGKVDLCDPGLDW